MAKHEIVARKPVRARHARKNGPPKKAGRNSVENGNPVAGAIHRPGEHAGYRSAFGKMIGAGIFRQRRDLVPLGGTGNPGLGDE